MEVDERRVARGQEKREGVYLCWEEKRDDVKSDSRSLADIRDSWWS